MTAELRNLLLLSGEAAIYFVVLAGLFRARRRLGIGAFFCALGVMHFLETYLASTFYVALPLGIVTSPGSSILFTGKLMTLLLVYIREDAVVVRQPIYGLLIGNLLMVLLAVVIRHHDLTALGKSEAVDLGLIDQMGALMVWGTAILFVDCLVLILLYERTRAWFGGWSLARILFSGAVVMTLDQVLFYAGLRWLTGAPVSVLLGGWIAKMGAVSLYAVLLYAYLRWAERPRGGARIVLRLSDVFDALTYRERYEDLLARSGRDPLTGALNRGRLETQGRALIGAAADHKRPASLLLIDIDHFKSFNDRFGHAAGDDVLKRIASSIITAVRSSDLVFRFGGEEFVVICEGLAADAAAALGERIRREIAADGADGTVGMTVSVGVASLPEDATGYDGLFALADRRLYEAKASGRNRIVGAPGVQGSDDDPTAALRSAGAITG